MVALGIHEAPRWHACLSVSASVPVWRTQIRDAQRGHESTGLKNSVSSGVLPGLGDQKEEGRLVLPGNSIMEKGIPLRRHPVV